MVLAVGLLTFAPEEAGASRGIESVSTIPLRDAGVQVAVDPSPDARLLYILEPEVAAEVVVRSLDPPFNVLATVPLSRVHPSGAVVGVTGPLAVDEKRHRLYVGASLQHGAVGHVLAGTEAGNRIGIWAVDGLLAIADQPGAVTGPIAVQPDLLTDPLSARRVTPLISALSYDPTRDRLYAVVDDLSVPVVVLEAFDPASCLSPQGGTCPQTGIGLLKWTYPIPECETSTPSKANFPGVPARPDRHVIYVGCTLLGNLNAAVTTPRPHQGVYRVETNGIARPQAHTFVAVHGDYSSGGALFDPVSERIVLHSRRFGPFGDLIIDGQHMAPIGIATAGGDLKGACLNKATGRYYVSVDSPNLLQVGEARATPTVAGVFHPEFFRDGGGTTTLDVGQVACDEATGRVFIPQQNDEDLTGNTDRSLLVVRDVNRAYTPDLPPNPDALTRDIPDDPKTSRPIYNSVGRAFGARIIETGGATSWTRTVWNQGDAPSINQLEGGIAPITGDIDSRSNRSVAFAQVGIGERSVSLSNGGVTAVASGGTHDEATGGNLSGNGSHDSPWPYAKVACPGEANALSATGASVQCRPSPGPNGEPPGAAGTAHAGHRNFDAENELGGFVSFEGADSAVETKLDPELGIVTEASASVRTVSLFGGLILLEDVRTTATASARGLPGSAKTSFERTVGRLVIEGQQICQPCNPQAVADGITEATGQVIRATVPKADSVFTTGTPKGAQSGVIRDPFEQLTDEVLNGVLPEDQQVPVLRLTIQPRGFQHNTVTLDLAATEVVSFRALIPCPLCSVVRSSGAPPSGGKTEPVTLPPIDSQSRAASNVGATVSPEAVEYITASVAPTPASTDPGGVVNQIFEALRKGLEALLTSPGRIPMLLAVWGVLLSPVYLSARRRLVLARQIRTR